MAIRYLYFIRHGQFKANPPKFDAGITTLGRRQARYAAKALKEVPITVIHASTMTRALETAEIIHSKYPDVPFRRAHRLQECLPPIDPELRELYWWESYTDEELAAQAAHAEKAYVDYVRRTAGKDRHEVIVSHGNLIRYIVCRVMGVDPTAWIRMQTRNCGITKIMVDADGDSTLLSYNEIGHIPIKYLTDNMHLEDDED